MIQTNENHRHFIIYKPDGYLSQFVNNQTKRTKKKLLGELYPFPENTMAIGRLDEDSEGLLLLTTNGKTSERVRSNEIEKEYYAQLDGIITNDAIEKLCEGVEIGFKGLKYTTQPCKAFKLESVPFLPERIKKIIIRADKKKYFLEKLFKYGVHHATVFPDLDGLSRYVKHLHDYR